MAERNCEGCGEPLGLLAAPNKKVHGPACSQRAYRARARLNGKPLRRLADLDVGELSSAALNGLSAAVAIADGASEAEVAADLGVTLEGLNEDIQQLQREWELHALRAKFRP